MPGHGGTDTVLAVSKQAFDDMLGAASDRAIAVMVLNGRCFLAPNGTLVQVLEKSGGKARVLVLEGPTMGREGWCLSEFVKVSRDKERWAERQREAEARAKAEKERHDAIEAAKWKTWTDSSGEHKIEAKFEGLAFGKVKLVKRDGSTIQLPLEKLCDEDQKWIKEKKWNQ